MDDSVLFVKTKEEAKDTLAKISKFLDEKLHLELNQKTQIFKSKQGVNFCGYKINAYRLKLRDKGKKKFKKKIKYLTGQIYKGKMSTEEARKYLCGHIGYMKYANCHNFLSKYVIIAKPFDSEKEKADQIDRKIKKSRKIVISGELTSAKKSKNHNQRCAILLEKFYYY